MKKAKRLPVNILNDTYLHTVQLQKITVSQLFQDCYKLFIQVI